MFNAAKRKAYTLMEVLVASSILAILVGLVVPAVQRARREAGTARTTNNFKQFLLAAQQHEQDFGPYGGVPLPDYNAAGAGPYTYHDVIQAYMNGYPLGRHSAEASMEPDGSHKHYKTARGYGFKIPGVEEWAAPDITFIDPLVGIRQDQSAIGIFCAKKEPFTLISPMGEGSSNRPVLFTRAIKTRPNAQGAALKPDDEESIPVWRGWRAANRGVNPVDALATNDGTDGGMDTERHGGGLMGLGDGHVERLNKESARYRFNTALER